MNEEISNYITQAQKHGLTEMEIKQNLLGAGWEAAAVEEAFVFSRAVETKNQTPGKPANSGYVSQPLSQNIKPIIMPGQQPAASPFHQNINISEQHFPSNNTAPILKKPAFWVALILILFLGAGAYGYYQYVYVTQAKILASIKLIPENKIFTTEYALSYSDKSGQGDASGTEGSITLAGKLYLNINDVSKPEIKDTLNLTLKSKDQEFSSGLGYLFLNQALFVNVGQNEKLKSIFPDQNIEWLKLDFVKLGTLLKNNSTSVTAESTWNNLNNDIKKQFVDIWSKSQVITASGSAKREKLNGLDVFHIQPKFNSDNFTKAAIASLDLLSKTAGTSTPEITEEQKTLTESFLKKFAVKELDLWVGQSDKQLYKIHILSNMPSIADGESPVFKSDVLSSPKTDPAAGDRDFKRDFDMFSITTKLDRFNTALGGYPDGKNGVPQNVPFEYISEFPTAPTPADGKCTEYYNTYWYEPVGKPFTTKGQTLYPDYSLTFCLGADVLGGKKAGIARASSKGIEYNIPCPSTEDKCVANMPNQETQPTVSQELIDQVNNLDFKGEFGLDLTFSNIGQSQTLTEPENSTDLIDFITTQFGQTFGKMATSTK